MLLGTSLYDLDMRLQRTPLASKTCHYINMNESLLIAGPASNNQAHQHLLPKYVFFTWTIRSPTPNAKKVTRSLDDHMTIARMAALRKALATISPKPKA